MDKEAVKDIVLNVNYPVILSGLQIEWKFLKEPLSEWLHAAHNDNKDPEFEVAPLTHGNSPQFERFRSLDKSINFGNFLDFSSSERQLKQWTSFSYKSIRDLQGATDPENPMNMSFSGFPEISEEITVWLGSPGAATSCHFDTYGRNVVVQAHGRKRWILFSPDTENMDPTRIPYEESSVYSERTFFSPKEPGQNHDLAEQAHIVDLNPGDVLIIPPKWWHYVEALDNSLSFNAWIPIEHDRVSRVDEFLVLHQLSKMIPNDLNEDKRALLLNPNFLHEDLSCSLDLLEVLIKDAQETDKDPPSSKKPRRHYQTNYLTEYQVEANITEHAAIVQRVRKCPDEFQKIMSHNSSRFSATAEENIKSTIADSQLTTLTALINSLCAPSTIESARKILLKSPRN